MVKVSDIIITFAMAVAWILFVNALSLLPEAKIVLSSLGILLFVAWFYNTLKVES